MLDLKQLTAEVCHIATDVGHFLREERKNFRRERVEEKHAHDAFVITELPYNHLQYKQTVLHLIDKLYGVVGGIRMNGSAAAAICYVAIGRFDAWAEAFLGKWDYSAAALIVQEAGGRVTNFYGEEHFIEGHHIIATNGHLHPLFQKLLAEVPPLDM